MMIKPKNITINGRELIKTYSDEGFMIERDGVRYSEAIDPPEFGRQYVETGEKIEHELEQITDEIKGE